MDKHKLDYWELVKSLAEKHGQQELIQVCNERINAIVKHQEEQQEKLNQLAEL